MCEVYEVDPDGDLLIILPSTDPFAPWNDLDDLEVIPKLSENDTEIGIDSSQISSKHLSLASPRFKKMLTGVWKEAHEIHKDGCRHVTLEGFDPGALKLMLDILHGKTRKVPRSLNLEMLAKVAVLVDDFECFEEVEVFTDIWLESLPPPRPAEYNRDLVLWILISSVFQKSKLFTSTASHCDIVYDLMALHYGTKYGLDKIDHERQELFDQLTGTLHNLLDKLREGEPICSFECDSMLLGAFIKQLHPLDLIWPRPLKPFTGLQFAETAEAIRRLQSPA
ncbi:hypothetical protein BKA65DRAFT_564458 [Rhexocercosporidium sp. MPI-PUGE-AT-0058]|nr:hypothetical protein BKA65DRAFT_564458 [Rhexocercosporidium sp. MPI-PUGE-AT-0058]